MPRSTRRGISIDMSQVRSLEIASVVCAALGPYNARDHMLIWYKHSMPYARAFCDLSTIRILPSGYFLELPGIGHRIKSIGDRLKNSYPDT